MTAKQYAPGTPLNKFGNGKGMKISLKPITKKRGVDELNKGATAVAARKYTNTSTMEGARSVSPDKPLTEKQKLFTKFWAQGESITSASMRAGYNDGAALAYRMVKMPNVLKLYNKEKALYEEASQMTRKRVMDGLLESIDMAKLMSEPASMISGWREIAKMCGYMEPVKHRLEVNVTGNIMMKQMTAMSDAELLRVIEEATKAEAQAIEYRELEGEDGDQP